MCLQQAYRIATRDMTSVLNTIAVSLVPMRLL